MKYITFFVALLVLLSCETQPEDKVATYQTSFEKSEGKETATYQETIDFYIRLAREFPEINIQTIGETDSGLPLHMVTFNPDGDFNLENVREDKAVILINNGIHPGESDGIDATMLFYRDLAIEKLNAPKHTVLVTIPIYNIGGALNRNSTTRINQNGPLEYGFRGNARNYDLNRDFIKMDTKNAFTFSQIFHLVKPDVFVDNHVSNGADYQYTLTHLFTQHNKLGGKLGQYLNEDFQPTLEKKLSEKDWDITPYVNVFNTPPESGFQQFMDYPRYSTGFSSLWNTLGLMVETHMLKPYKKRVEGTYELMSILLTLVEKEYKTIKKLREETTTSITEKTQYHFNWRIDTTRTSKLNFKGYEASSIKSEVTGLPRLKYDRTKPFVKETVFYNYFYPKDTVQVPAAYVVKKVWQKVIDRLNANAIKYYPLEKDTVLKVESYKILGFETRRAPYEGHYPHYNTQVDKSTKEIQFSEGDLLVPTNQHGFRYLMETLEPQAEDSFFNWNFFDSVLQQKEDFSPYVFEDMAYEILMKDSILRADFLAKKEFDEEFNQNWYAQLKWVHQNSGLLEESYMRYPIYRIPKGGEAEAMIPLE